MKKVALFTGGGRSIGFAIAEKLAADGFNLVFSGRSDISKVTDAVQALEKLGAEVLYCSADVSSAEDRTAMLAEIKERFTARLGEFNIPRYEIRPDRPFMWMAV